MNQQPEPGVYYGMSFADYAAIPYMNNSRLGAGVRSMLHLKNRMDFGSDYDSDALRLGRAGHASTLEPDNFARSYIVLPETFVNSKGETKPLNRMSKEGKAAIETYERNHEVLKQAEYDQCISIRDAVRSHPGAAALLGRAGAFECVVVWRDADTGVMCKCRIDAWIKTDKGGIIVDLKTTEDASPGGFARSYAKYKYYRQFAFYGDGVASRTGTIPRCIIIAVEKSTPYAVATYECDEESLLVGQAEYKKVLSQWAIAEMDGSYPGYDPQTQFIGLPRWAMPKEDD